ncbi:MAG: LGFP repeat-containing protein, partial [Planctomycetaceae bacterium]
MAIVKVNPHPNDRLTLAAPKAVGGVTLKDGIVFLGTSRVGPLIGGEGATPLVVYFDGPGATPKAAQAILRQLVFSNGYSDVPSILQRTVATRVLDDQGNFSNAIAQTIAITPLPPTTIDTKWTNLGGPSGALGNPVGPEAKSPAADWIFRRFERGTIFSHPKFGTFSSTESIENWNSSARESGKAGLPRLDASDMPKNVDGTNVGRSASSATGTYFFRLDTGVSMAPVISAPAV